MKTDAYTWDDEPMMLHENGANAVLKQDLEERTARFGETVKIPQTAVNTRILSQLVGSATSVGANYCEADDAVSESCT